MIPGRADEIQALLVAAKRDKALLDHAIQSIDELARSTELLIGSISRYLQVMLPGRYMPSRMVISGWLARHSYCVITESIRRAAASGKISLETPPDAMAAHRYILGIARNIEEEIRTA